jgi:hypothetical protein
MTHSLSNSRCPHCETPIPPDATTPQIFLYVIHLKEVHPELTTPQETPDALRRAS